MTKAGDKFMTLGRDGVMVVARPKQPKILESQIQAEIKQ